MYIYYIITNVARIFGKLSRLFKPEKKPITYGIRTSFDI